VDVLILREQSLVQLVDSLAQLPSQLGIPTQDRSQHLLLDERGKEHLPQEHVRETGIIGKHPMEVRRSATRVTDDEYWFSNLCAAQGRKEDRIESERHRVQQREARHHHAQRAVVAATLGGVLLAADEADHRPPCAPVEIESILHVCLTG
jgi:hypothetical protein